jgi:glycosyltransferase involved in cell wall biosynthesis/2-polyprenyl-3-methyl-5-hydroxy-6-metoxy-1,4-benzoquinol methylase
MGMPFNGETVQTKSLGGSESAAYYQARELAARGYKVTVFTTSEQQGNWDGVDYLCVGNIAQDTPLGRDFEWYARNTPHDVIIIQRHQLAFHKKFASKINIWQLHDLALFRTAAVSNHGMWQIDAVTTVSKWHKDQVCEVYGFDPDFVRVVTNGVDPDIYQAEGFRHDMDTHFAEWKEKLPSDAFKLLYSSRPERGLEHLVRPGGIMDRLSDTDAHLFVCGYDNTVPQMRGYYQQLEEWGKALGNVTFLGALSKPQLAALQRSCDLACYPTEFNEVSCITAMECMHAGLPMLTSAVGALPETCELVDAGVELIPLTYEGKADENAFVDVIRDMIYEPGQKTLAGYKAAQLKAANFKTWVKAVDHLDNVINEAFSRRHCSDTTAMRHSIEHSDIAFAQWLSPTTHNPINDRTADELDELYEFANDPLDFSNHYATHQTEYYDKFEDKVIGEDVTSTTRFRGVSALMVRHVSKRGGACRVLDYGCAHGHYLIPLAKMFPKCKFSGVDVSSRAIGAAMKWVEKEGLINIEQLVIGAQDLLTSKSSLTPVVGGKGESMDALTGERLKSGPRDLFDIIVAGEVLEHVLDPYALLEGFRSVLKPGGVIIITTPIGRWEWTGTENFRKAREHLHHFERQDIIDICAGNEHDIMCAPAGQDKTGDILGSWVWAVEPTVEFGTVDYNLKRKFLAPRQTVSACLIVKDGEKTLRRCIESFVDWVDEIVVGIDPTTTDRTREVLEHLAQDYKWKPFTVFDGLEALKDGFDEARNLTVKRASCDWVLWCDDDEEIQQPWNMWKYLRPSQHKAIGFPQVHYSTNPPTVLTTDFPFRLFRRDVGVKFYGVVHEHPETEVGKSIPNATLRHDVQFLHSGYVDEETRRERFRRNLPLLHKDREKFPDRGLNRYLMLRDIAQGLAFELEQTGGNVLEGQPDRAQLGIKLFEEMLDKNDPVRSLIEALKYYTHCVQVTGTGFDVKLSMAFKSELAPDLAATLDAEGRFHSKEFFSKFITRLHEEATKQYESKYL